MHAAGPFCSIQVFWNLASMTLFEHWTPHHWCAMC